MGRKRKQRRQAHGSAWHWRQTDCWYYTAPGTKKRVALFDEEGQRIRGKGSKEAAELALAKEKLAWQTGDSGIRPKHGQWLVAGVCSEYLQYCQRGLANGEISKGHCDNATSWLNNLCEYCGALPVVQLKKGHIKTWIENHKTWRSPATHRAVIAIVLAAFNRAEEMCDVSNPLKGLKKPRSRPRLHSIGADDEEILYEAAEECFRNFLFAAIHTGLRPFCELARITADEIEETDRGMMWRVYSTKTKKTPKIPVRPEVAERARKLTKTAPKGSGLPLLRNTIDPWPAGEIRRLRPELFDERYSQYRLPSAELDQAMVRSLHKYGQLSPIVVCRREETPVLIDGFKRLRASRRIEGMTRLFARRIEADEVAAKAAIYGLNQIGRRPCELEEAWIVHSLVREDGLPQMQVAEMRGRHKSWVCLRLALLEKLIEEARDDLRLGLLSVSAVRQLIRLPAGDQAELMAAMRRRSLRVGQEIRVAFVVVATVARPWLSPPTHALASVATTVKKEEREASCGDGESCGDLAAIAPLQPNRLGETAIST